MLAWLTTIFEALIYFLMLLNSSFKIGLMVFQYFLFGIFSKKKVLIQTTYYYQHFLFCVCLENNLMQDKFLGPPLVSFYL